MPNRLARELSPYLLQHAENPVDWFPWGDDAFTKAQTESKPIFLSVGYSTCHWCHVMESESFENADVADVLNHAFVSVKVDREERPDVDRVYMAFVQAVTGSGGWPMSVWLTPDLKPFFGGTYFPPTARGGRPGFIEILREIARLWGEERSKLLGSADALMERLRETSQTTYVESGATDVAGPETLQSGVQEYQRTFDAANGGFGSAPKFPRPSELLFLLREHRRTGEPQPAEMALTTLRAMANGGLRDHIGGGFHRYAVDGEWRIPHFEKMLYDQAQLAIAYLEAGQMSGDPLFLEVADETLRYVSRDLTAPDGGCCSAEDADSLEPGDDPARVSVKREGAFYVWTNAELETLLGDDLDVVRARFGVEPDGNATHDPTGELRGKNHLYLARTIDDVAQRCGWSAEDVAAALTRARETLFDARARRPRPHLDDKILTAWNGLIIAAWARAASVFDGEPRGVSARAHAVRAARFARTQLWDEKRQMLYRRFRGGHASIDGYAEDYAFLVWGLLELFQVEGQAEWLDWAIELQDRQDTLFWDETDGGWFSTTGADRSVLLRLKDDYDGAEPSPGSVAVHNLLRLAHLTGNQTYQTRGDRAMARFGARLGQAARVLPMMAAALSHRHAGTSQIVILGPRDRDDTHTLRRVLASHYLPFAVHLHVEPGDPQQALAARIPFIASMSMHSGRATAFVCADFACQEPVTDGPAFDAQLTSLHTGVAAQEVK